MELSIIKHFMIMSAVISDQFGEEIDKHSNCNYWQRQEIICDIVVEIFKKFENDFDHYTMEDYLNNLIIETKRVLLEKYKVDLLSNATD